MVLVLRGAPGACSPRVTACVGLALPHPPWSIPTAGGWPRGPVRPESFVTPPCAATGTGSGGWGRNAQHSQGREPPASSWWGRSRWERSPVEGSRVDGWTCSPRGEGWCFILLTAAPPSTGL